MNVPPEGWWHPGECAGHGEDNNCRDLRGRIVGWPEPLGWDLDYVALLEIAVEELDKVISDAGPTIHRDNPDDFGISPETANIVVNLRKQ